MRLLALALLVGCADAPANTPTERPEAQTVPEAEPAPAPEAAPAPIPEATADPAPGAEPAPVPEAAAVDDWAGRYTFSEGGGVYTYRYVLDLSPAGPEAPDQYVGTLDVDGPQVTIRFDVLGEMSDGGFGVVLVDYRPENANRLQTPGELLFSLRWEDAGEIGDEIGDRVLRTYWGTLRPTGAGEESPEAGSSLAFVFTG
ncbi:MAG: DUF5991 domain-containing protein [Bacteroidota bacterium]